MHARIHKWGDIVQKIAKSAQPIPWMDRAAADDKGRMMLQRRGDSSVRRSCFSVMRVSSSCIVIVLFGNVVIILLLFSMFV